MDFFFLSKDAAKVSMSGEKSKKPLVKPHARPQGGATVGRNSVRFGGIMCGWCLFLIKTGQIMRSVPLLAPN